MNQAAAIGHASRLHERAREHKRAEREHRRRARDAMDELRQFCAEHGIALTVIDDRDLGGQSQHEHKRRS